MDRVKASGLDFPESSRLKKHLSAATDWINKANSALAGSIQLRDLDKLLTEADKLAVDPGPKLDELKAKMDKALVWLEKVRKAVPRQRATRRNAPDVEAEKVGSSFHFFQSIRIFRAPSTGEKNRLSSWLLQVAVLMCGIRLTYHPQCMRP